MNDTKLLILWCPIGLLFCEMRFWAVCPNCTSPIRFQLASRRRHFDANQHLMYWSPLLWRNVCDGWEALKPKNGVCCLRWEKRPLTCDTAPTASLFLGFLGVGGGSWHTPLGGHVTRAAINPSTPAREGRYLPHLAPRFSQPYSDVLREHDNNAV
jgi:hypothetical protein